MKTLKFNNRLKTKLFISFLMFFSMAFFPQFGNANSATFTEQRSVKGFHEIEIGGSFTIILVQGTTEGVKLETETETMKHVVTKVEGQTLKIYYDEKYSSHETIVVTINFIDLNSLDCSGSSDLSSQGKLKFTKFELESGGASKVNLNLSADKLNVSISGSGSFTLSGSSKDVDLDISGSGKFSASTLNAENYDIDISGSGNAEVAAANTLKVAVSGSGKVRYLGNPEVKKLISGSGSVMKM